MDPTLLTILVLLAIATVVAVLQARQRDKCLRSFEGFPVTVANKDGKLTWGRLRVFTTGMELAYRAPVLAAEGHLEESFLFFKDEYERIDVLYRLPESLSPEEQEARRRSIRRTAHPGLFRRLGRQLRNWIALLRDALVQSVGLVIGAAKARQPGLTGQEQSFQKLSSEIIGHAGNAFDPLLEAHLFTQVVLEVTTNGKTRSYCGWLKDYTATFIEVVDAFGNDVGAATASETYPSDALPEGVEGRWEGERLILENRSERLLYAEHAAGPGWRLPLDCTLPPGGRASMVLPTVPPPSEVQVRIGLAGRVDLVVPRAHALVRHGAAGSEERRRARITGERQDNRAWKVIEEDRTIEPGG